MTINAHTGLTKDEYIINNVYNKNNLAAGNNTYIIDLKSSEMIKKLILNSPKYGFIKDLDSYDVRYPKEKYVIFESSRELEVVYLIINTENNQVILQIVKM